MKFNFESTGIGSVPFKDPKEACRIVLDNFKSIPFWPQLPKKTFLENMYVQYSETIPGLILDEKSRTLHIETSKVASDIENVYTKYLDGDLDFFSISKEYASGLYHFIDQSQALPKGVKFIKGHITGPISYGLFLTDQNKRSIIHDRDLFEILTKILVMKARWQIKMLKKCFGSVIIFIDEPYLVSIGSSFININIGEVFKKLDELIEAIKKEGAMVGLHCCGNTDWPMLLKRDIDILNFDTYNFMKEFSLYASDIKDFLRRGRTIAWGIVPSSEDIYNNTRHDISDKLSSAIKMLTDKGIKKDEISSLVTSSCGVGTLDDKAAIKVFESVKSVSSDFKG